MTDTSDKTGMSQTFDPSTDVYAKADAMFEADGFNGSIAVIEYPASSTTPSVSSSSDGSVDDDQQPGIVKALAGYLYSGILYIVPTSDVSESDLEALTDFTYTNGHCAVMVQFSDASDAQNLDNHVKSAQADKNKLHNVFGAVIPDTSDQPVAQACAYAVGRLPRPTDFMKIGNGTQFEPSNLTPDQMNAVENAECATVTDRANDIMFNSSRAMGGGFIDQFVDSQFVIDAFAHTSQHFLDHNECNDDDATRNQLHITLASKAAQLRAAGMLTGAVDVIVPSRDEQSSDDAESRVLNGVRINANVYDPIEHINGSIAITY